MKPNIVYLKKIKNSDKTLAKLNKKEREKIQITKIRNESEDNTINITEIKRM